MPVGSLCHSPTRIIPTGPWIQLPKFARRQKVFVFGDKSNYRFDFHHGQVPILPLASKGEKLSEAMALVG
ncbi:MAG: hypothetical protein AAFN92_14750 [Bacteroidota bacterium]